MDKKYKTAMDFKKALTAKLKEISKRDGVDIQRLQRRVAFDRLLCRLFSDKKMAWVLKGGHALELRIDEARATMDIDLAMRAIADLGAKENINASELILQEIQKKASLDLHDYFEFTISVSNEDLQGPPYGGSKFHVDVQIAGTTYVEFNLDVGIGDVWIEPYETIQLKDWLGFADIQSLSIPIISKEQHFAEKLHAYTLPRESKNSRVKDLVDLYLLMQKGDMNILLLKQAIKLTFERRKTHAVPQTISSPPEDWAKPFKAMALECRLNIEMMEGYNVLNTFYKKCNIHET
ncbi:MAG: hypothetical protein ACD_79C00738G0003 [uncultured bacterium]|nr:MAG: hypothetical protein ACD_79C00738G0003 [uncultured bacterium]